MRKRGNAWQAIVKVTDTTTGRSRQISGTRQTKGEAESLLIRLLTEAGRSDAAAAGATLGDLLTAWQSLNAGNWSPGTVRNTRALVDHYIRPRFGAIVVRKLRTSDLDLFYAELRRHGGHKTKAAPDGTRPLAAGTVQKVHNAIRSALEHAVRWEWVTDNPARRATLPRGPRSSIKPPRPRDVVRLIETAADHDPDFGAFLHLAAVTGARRGELCALRWHDVDLELGLITIERSIAMGDTIVEKDTKTGNRRRINVGPDIVAVLKAHRVRAAERTLAAGAALAGDAFVFSLDVGGATPWRPDLPTMRFARLRDELELPTVRLHDLRHFHATTLLGAGVDLATVAGRLGHAGGGRTTLAVYAHALEHADQGAATLIDNVIRSGAN